MKTKQHLHKLTAWLIAFTMLFTMLPGMALTANAETAATAPTDSWHDYAADSFGGGGGTSAEPYVIKTAEQLAKLSKDVINGNAYKDTYFILDDNIDLSGHRWIPIGVHKWTADDTTVAKPFSGSFDGNEKTVSNMYIDSSLDGDYQSGFFGSISGYGAAVSPVIKDLTIDDATVNYNAQNQNSCVSGIFAGRIGGNETPRVQISNITVSDSTLTNTAISPYYDLQSGGFAGYLDYALIQNCHTKNVTITGGANNGGFVGLTSSLAAYENCSTNGSVSGGWALGGFAGYAVTNVSFTKCIADVDITANNWNVGGFCGYATYGISFNKCVAYGDIQSTVTTFEPKLGGFAGTLAKIYYDDFAAASSMTNCYFAGTLTSAHETIKPSGLVALVEESTITDCAYDGEVNTDIKGYTDETASTALSTNNLKAEICVNVLDGHDMEDGVCSNCGYTEYGIYVNGIQVTNFNAADVLGTADEGATVKYDAAAQKLTLNNASITEPSSVSCRAGIYIDDFTDPVTIELVGENNITLTNTAYDNNGIWNDSDADLTISGTGALAVTQYNDYSPFGIWNQNSDLTIKNCNVTFNLAEGSAANGFLVDCAENIITVDGAAISAEGFLQGLFAEGDISVKNSSNIDITAIENAIYSDSDITIEGNSTVKATTTEVAAICSWSDITITNSDVTAESEYDNGIYCFGLITVSGGKVTVNSSELDALQGFGGIEVKNNATVTAESANGAGIYTGETLDVLSGTVTATGTTKAIVARRISDNASDNQPTESAVAITLGSNVAEESGATIKTEDWAYVPVWDPEEWNDIDKWMSRSYFVDSTDTPVTTAKIITKAPQTTTGGGGLALYTVKFNSNGGSKVSAVKVYRNDAVDEPTAPVRDGYTFDGWCTDEELTKAYDFASKVKKSFTLYAKWVKSEKEPDDTNIHTCPSKAFNDLDVTAWYHLDTDYVIENGIFNGITDTTFEPDSYLTRAMLVTVLYRIEGEPTTNKSISFADVDMSAYYANAVVWGQQNGIIEGHSETEFAPDDNITREQFATIMYRYAQFKGYDMSVGENTNILSYDDFDRVSEYAISAIQYAVGSGLINGKTDTTINPQDNATRAECAAILHRFIESNK